MYEIVGTTIRLTRGDTFVTEVGMRSKTTKEPYIPQEGDVVRFALKRKLFGPDKGYYIDQKPLVLKVIPNETLVLRVDPEDTKPYKFGIYAYDIELTYANGTVDTFLSGDLELLPEVD